MPLRRPRCRSYCGARIRSPPRRVETRTCAGRQAVTPPFGLFVLRRLVASLILVLAVASAALLLARLAPGDHLSEFELTPQQLRAERQRLGLDRPLYQQYLEWVSGALRLDFGESTRYPGRAVSSLIAERAGNSILLGTLSLIVATLIGIPLGALAGSGRRGPHLAAARAGNILLLSLPLVVLSLGLLLIAA